MGRELPEAERVLAPYRAEIDALDAELVVLLARRLDVVRRVIDIKRDEGLAALLPERVEDVIDKVTAHALAHDVPKDLVEHLWRVLIAWVVAYEDARLR
ncbi:MAG TPA: chorismate mutase [Xanthobacteraceae bacterium]|nr:chorismate mutase [Xanthobacteraceae bacterium]